MEKCAFCNKLMYNDISSDIDWHVTMYEDSWNMYHFLDIEHNADLGDFGIHKYSTSVLINYCPICGRKLEDN